MKPEFILAVNNEVFSKECNYSLLTKKEENLEAITLMPFLNGVADVGKWLEEIVDPEVIFARRDYLETNPNYRQLLPYIVVYCIENDTIKVLTYQRTKKVGEVRLGGKYSIGIGGHVDLEVDMFKNNQTPTIKKILYHAARREVFEEIKPDWVVDYINDFNLYQGPQYIILDSTDDVGKVHAGLAYFADISSLNKLHKGEAIEAIDFKEEELTKVGFLTLEELEKLNLENWSIIVKNTLLDLQDKINKAKNKETIETKPLGQPDLQG